MQNNANVYNKCQKLHAHMLESLRNTIHKIFIVCISSPCPVELDSKNTPNVLQQANDDHKMKFVG